jgi:hypothetical protein
MIDKEYDNEVFTFKDGIINYKGFIFNTEIIKEDKVFKNNKEFSKLINVKHKGFCGNTKKKIDKVISVFFKTIKLSGYSFKLERLEYNKIIFNLKILKSEKYTNKGRTPSKSLKYHIIKNIDKIKMKEYESYYEFLYDTNLITFNEFALLDKYHDIGGSFDLLKSVINTSFNSLDINIIETNDFNYIINTEDTDIELLKLFMKYVLKDKIKGDVDAILEYIEDILPNNIPDSLHKPGSEDTIFIDNKEYRVNKKNIKKSKFEISFYRPSPWSHDKNNRTKNKTNPLYEYCKYIQTNFPQEYYIYKYTNKLSGLSYIGITSDLLNRQRNRTYDPTTPFDHTLRAIGVENFEFGVVDYAETRDEALDLEKQYIIKYNSLNGGYNMKM